MEGPPEPVRKPSPRRRVVLVIIVAAVVVTAGFVVWWEFIRPRTIAEVYAFDHFQPGTSVTVQGTITRIDRENTSYGPKVTLQLDGYTGCNTTLTPGLGTGQVFGDPNATYTIGQTFQTTLHFQSYTINGDAAVSAPELACPLPGLFAAIGNVFDTISRIRGILLVYNASEPGGWQDYRIFTRNGEAYNLSVLPVSLAKSVPYQGNNPTLPAGSSVDSMARWGLLLALQYIGATGGAANSEFPIVDRMSSLRDGTSVNGSLRFIDANGDGKLDDGDRLDVRLPPTTANAWDTYLLQVGDLGGLNATYAATEHFVLQGPEGPLDPLLSSQRAMVDLAYNGTQPGPPLQSTVRVASVPIGPARPLSAIRYSLVLNRPTSFSNLSGTLASLPATTATGVTFSFSDTNADNLLDAGDRFTVTGAANQTGLLLFLFDPDGGIGELNWIVGYGAPVYGLPYTTLTVRGSGPWTIGADVASWSPDTALNGTLRATLLENGNAVLTNASLVNGTVGTFANGSLSFTDADGDGYLSTGDYFTLSGNPADRYELDLTAFFGEYRIAAFT